MPYYFFSQLTVRVLTVMWHACVPNGCLGCPVGPAHMGLHRHCCLHRGAGYLLLAWIQKCLAALTSATLAAAAAAAASSAVAAPSVRSCCCTASFCWSPYCCTSCCSCSLTCMLDEMEGYLAQMEALVYWFQQIESSLPRLPSSCEAWYGIEIYTWARRGFARSLHQL